MALIIVLSAFNGLSELVRSLYNSFDAEISITAKQGKTFEPNSNEIQSIKKIEVIEISGMATGWSLLGY